jgi:ligand-binding sensor domain-containing protein
LYASTDYGKTWTTIGTDLPAEPINVVREDPVNANLLYVGTDHGLYVSLDKGKTFMHANGTMPGVAIHDLQIHPRENELIVGTHGRSIYVGDVKPLQKMTTEYLSKNLVVNSLEDVSHNPSWGRMRNSFVEAREQKFLIQYYAKSAGEAKMSIKTADGLVIQEMTDVAEAGLNEVNYDLGIDSKIQKKYEKELTKEDDKSPVIIEAADDKKMYIQPGKYTIEISQNGNTTSEKFEVKARKKKTRKNAVPQGSVSPDEFEEWYEDMGFEEVKK